MTDTTPARPSIFLGVMGAPYESELCTTLLRLVDAALRQGHPVTVWTCGGATTLTLRSLGDTKPRNLFDLGTERRDATYPSTAALVTALLTMAEGRLQWLVCRHCMEERGATDQISGVVVKPPLRFLHYRDQADTALILGVK